MEKNTDTEVQTETKGAKGADKAPKVNPLEAKVRAGVDAFIAVHLRNSSFSQDTPAWNHFQAGLPVLIEAIVKELEG